MYTHTHMPHTHTHTHTHAHTHTYTHAHARTHAHTHTHTHTNTHTNTHTHAHARTHAHTHTHTNTHTNTHIRTRTHTIIGTSWTRTVSQKAWCVFRNNDLMQWLQSMVHDLAAHCPLNRAEVCILVSPVVLLLALCWGVYPCIPQFVCVWQILNWTEYLPSETKVSVVMTMCLCVWAIDCLTCQIPTGASLQLPLLCLRCFFPGMWV